MTEERDPTLEPQEPTPGTAEERISDWTEDRVQITQPKQPEQPPKEPESPPA